jgi:S1-C subfamily serine protease
VGAAVNVAVVADEPLARAGLSALLEEDENVVVIAAVPAADAYETLLEVEALDVIVWEVAGEPVRHLEVATALLDGSRIGEAVQVRFVRGGEVREIDVVVGERT